MNIGSGSHHDTQETVKTTEPTGIAEPQSGAPPPLERWRLLVVDDDASEFPLLEAGFALAGADVELMATTNAYVALAELSLVRGSARPHLALVDIGMPMISGFELARQLIAQGMPTVLMSVLINPFRATQARELGVVDLLSKPADVEGYAAFAARLQRIAKSLRRP